MKIITRYIKFFLVKKQQTKIKVKYDNDKMIISN